MQKFTVIWNLFLCRRWTGLLVNGLSWTGKFRFYVSVSQVAKCDSHLLIFSLHVLAIGSDVFLGLLLAFRLFLSRYYFAYHSSTNSQAKMYGLECCGWVKKKHTRADMSYTLFFIVLIATLSCWHALIVSASHHLDTFCAMWFCYFTCSKHTWRDCWLMGRTPTMISHFQRSNKAWCCPDFLHQSSNQLRYV